MDKESHNKNATTKVQNKNNDIKTSLSLKNMDIALLDTVNLDVDLNNEDDNNEPKPTTKEEEWITKKKTELTTTRQIETRVKRKILLEDGKVVDDSGPMVSTNTTEDTDKKETETSEVVNFGTPQNDKGKLEISDGNQQSDIINTTATTAVVNKPRRKKWLKAEPGSIILKTEETDDNALVLAPRLEDGLVREIENKRVISHEEIDERTEIEDIKNLGDFSDETYIKAVKSGAENLEDILYSESNKKLQNLGPRIVEQTSKTHKIVDTEDVNQKSLVKSDGTLVTEKKKTTEHEEFFDRELSDDEKSVGNDVKAIESSQRYFKQRDEQNVEYVADGKVIAKEMRYAAETEQMEKEGPHEGPNDWDSLSDRIRKTRNKQKTILQHQRGKKNKAFPETALLADRKDALTKRPLNFDREEETRKGETMKWLESHFGSESTASSDSKEGDQDSDQLEPSKKTFFNVTIKSNHAPAVTAQNYRFNNEATNIKHQNGVYKSAPKVLVPEKNVHVPNGKTKYYQGISNWSDRKESNPKHFASKAFKDELQGIVKKKNLKHVSREDLRFLKSLKTDDDIARENLDYKKAQYEPGVDLKYYKRHSRENSEDSKYIKSQKQDFEYLNGSKKDLRYRKDSNDERTIHNLIKTNSRLKREDSGYVKDSREDIRSSALKDIDNDSSLSYRQSMTQKHDSLYASSSNFTDSRLQKIPQLRTPDSGIRSPSPEPYDTNTNGNYKSQRPAVPLRKRMIERKLKQQTNPLLSSNQSQNNHFEEPPPDYSPPPRSRSISPTIHLHPEVTHNLSSGIESRNNYTLSNGGSLQSRGTPEMSLYNPNNLSHSNLSTLKPTVSTQTSPQPKQPTKVGQAIGNSFRKLVGKIRSASAERKLKLKSKTKSRERSPSPLSRNKSLPNESTYQQYNVIDSHIGEAMNGEEIGSSYGNSVHFNKNHNLKTTQTHSQQKHPINRESSFVSTSVTPTGLRELQTISNSRNHLERLSSGNFDKNLSDPYDPDPTSCPKQRYYLGEDPYGNSIFGKENKYKKMNRESSFDPVGIQNANSRREITGTNGGDFRETYGQKNISSSTLGRYQKSNQRHLGSTPNLDCDIRAAQTLPRKTERRPSHHSSTINVSIVNQLKPSYNTGPAKPARTYTKPTLNRSKSFNVHGLNGTNDPSPIYLEKLTKNNYTGNIYKSNPHLNETGPQLKSPSIVNLISRSQKDLSKLYTNDELDRKYSNHNMINRNNIIKPNDEKVFQTIVHDNGKIYKYSDGRNHHLSRMSSKPTLEIVKDTASILRRGSSSTEEFNESFIKSSTPVHITQTYTKPKKIAVATENDDFISSRSSKYNGAYNSPNSSVGTTIIEVKGGKLRK